MYITYIMYITIGSGSERFDIRSVYFCAVDAIKNGQFLFLFLFFSLSLSPGPSCQPFSHYPQGQLVQKADGRVSALYFRPSTLRTVDKSNRVRRSKP